VSGLGALLLLTAAFVLQAGLGQLWPQSHAYVDALLAPVGLCALAGSQRAATFLGCASGLLTDAWFRAAPFGLSGFKRTILGFTMGLASTWLDLNHAPGRIAAGAVLSLADDLLELLLRVLFAAHPAFPGPLALLVRAVTTGLLVAGGGFILDKSGWGRPARRVV